MFVSFHWLYSKKKKRAHFPKATNMKSSQDEMRAIFTESFVETLFNRVTRAAKHKKMA